MLNKPKKMKPDMISGQMIYMACETAQTSISELYVYLRKLKTDIKDIELDGVKAFRRTLVGTLQKNNIITLSDLLKKSNLELQNMSAISYRVIIDVHDILSKLNLSSFNKNAT